MSRHVRRASTRKGPGHGAAPPHRSPTPRQSPVRPRRGRRLHRSPAHPARPPGAGGSGPAGFEERVLFKAGHTDHGPYSCFRIPALVTTARGTLLAFAEGRKGNCGDATDIDLVLKRSTDGGRTWGPLLIVDEGLGDTHGNPAPVVDRATGRVVVVTTYNAGRPDAGNCDVPCARTPT
ncbi:hypothetical protein ACFQ2B_05625 [Streptomyces stramineus]